METELQVMNGLSLANGVDRDHDTVLANHDEDIGQKEVLLRKNVALNGLQYRIDESPQWYLSALLGFQHYLTMFGGTISLPFILGGIMCFEDKPLVIAEVMNTIFFACGINTLLQTTVGSRLPIVQGGTFTFIGPSRAILSLPKFKCTSPNAVVSPSLGILNATSVSILNSTLSTKPTSYSSVEDDWKIRMNEICGAIMVSALFQVIIGYSGLVGLLLRFIGPLTIAPTISLVGLHLFPTAVGSAGDNWIISIFTALLILLFSLVLAERSCPIPSFSLAKGCHIVWFKAFKLFPVILSLLLGWLLSIILTFSNVLTDDPNDPGYKARADARISVIKDAKWFHFPYPGQWGTPTVSVAGVFGMLAGVLSSIIESVGDYYACARLAGAPPPPKHAINRGIGTEGLGCIISGSLGTGNGTTSYSENIAAIGITKVGSRRVVQAGAIVMIIFGLLGKFGALFSSIPTPVIGGMYLVLFGVICAVGISNLQFVDLNSPRNISIFGFSILCGMGIPYWIKGHPSAITTGSLEVNQILYVILSTEIALGGFLAILLDNLVPGTLEERGMKAWTTLYTEDESSHAGGRVASSKVYDLPSPLQRLVDQSNIAKYFPFLPKKDLLLSSILTILLRECAQKDNAIRFVLAKRYKSMAFGMYHKAKAKSCLLGYTGVFRRSFTALKLEI